MTVKSDAEELALMLEVDRSSVGPRKGRTMNHDTQIQR